MMYGNERTEQLKEAFSGEKNAVFKGLEIVRFHFLSGAADLLPGGKGYFCTRHHASFERNSTYYNDVGTISEDIHISDNSVKENREFTYHLMKPDDGRPARQVTFLFHGFNEKNWDKYLPWGEEISRQTGGAVVLFPIAFHMQRAPALWSDPREMFRLSETRKRSFPNVINSSLSNVAISMRLHAMPQRFIWSGLQTYDDMIRLIESYKGGENAMIRPDFTFNIFAYSIGGFLAEILKLSNYSGYFNDTKVCLFCGGSVFNRFSPVTKFILDSEANLALYSYLVEHFGSFLAKEPRLRHYIEEDHMEGKVFHAMLNYQLMREFRESLFRKSAGDFYAITLKKDRVIPAFEVKNTLQGAYGDIGIEVETLDFPYEYTHENPFPLKRVDPLIVDDGFNLVFRKACAFLNVT
jgi:hypothetical protein